MVEEINILLPQFEIKEVLNLLGGYGRHYLQDLQDVNTVNNVQEHCGNDGRKDFAFEETKNGTHNAANKVHQHEKDEEKDFKIIETDKSSDKSCSKPTEECSLICSDCGKMFSSNQLKKHRHKMHSNFQRKYSCDTCDLSFNLPSDLRRHKKNHEEPKFKCEKCFKLFKSKFNLVRHTKFCI